MDRLIKFLHCYNIKCITHDEAEKEAEKEYLEAKGIIFAEYHKKIYVYDIRKKSNLKKDFCTLAKVIKDVNELYKTDKTILEEYKHCGYYFVPLNGYVYFEKFVFYEMVTNLYFDEYKTAAPEDAARIKSMYDKYKKYV